MRNKRGLLIILLILWCAFGAYVLSEAGVKVTFLKPSLVGNWESVNYSSDIWVSSFPDEINIMNDGTLSLDSVAGTYSVDGDTLNIKASWVAISYEYSISGDTLTLSMDDKSVTYEREEAN